MLSNEPTQIEERAAKLYKCIVGAFNSVDTEDVDSIADEAFMLLQELPFILALERSDPRREVVERAKRLTDSFLAAQAMAKQIDKRNGAHGDGEAGQ
jgi:hypothetical protein